MRLVISKRFTRKFVTEFIKDYIKSLLQSYVVEGTFKNSDIYLKWVLKLEDDTYTILSYIVDNSIDVEDKAHYIIELSHLGFYKDTDYTVASLLNLIEYGNLELMGTHVFNKIFKRINSYIYTLYDIYLGGGY